VSVAETVPRYASIGRAANPVFLPEGEPRDRDPVEVRKLTRVR
jgi:hypothetical protein